VSDENGEMFKKIIEGINKGSEEETEILKLNEEIGYKRKFGKLIYGVDLQIFLGHLRISEYLKNEMNELVNGKEESEENEYYLILSYCFLINWIDKNEKIRKKIKEYFKELKMDKINSIEEKKKRLKEILGLNCFKVPSYKSLKNNI